MKEVERNFIRFIFRQNLFIIIFLVLSINYAKSKIMYDVFFEKDEIIITHINGSKVGGINRNMDVVIDTVFDHISGLRLNENEFPVPAEINEKWGCINSKGETVIPFEYNHIDKVDSNLFVARVDNKGVQLINTKNEVLIDIDKGYWDIGSFSDGLAPAEISGKQGYINKFGEVIIPFIYDIASPFNGDIARVTIIRKEDSKTYLSYKYIDRKGNYLNHLDGYDIENLSFNGGCGLLPFQKGGHFGFIDNKGNINFYIQDLIDIVHSKITEDRIIVKNANKYGFLDIKGNKITENIYEDCKNFQEGFAAVKKDGKWGFINKDGFVIIKCNIDMLFSNFYKGIAIASVMGIWESQFVIISKPSQTSKQIDIKKKIIQDR